MNVKPIEPLMAATDLQSGSGTPTRTFAEAFVAALDGAAAAVAHADGLAGQVAAGSGNVIDASVARAKADVLLEIVSVCASRVSGAATTLLQTQV